MLPPMRIKDKFNWLVIKWKAGRPRAVDVALQVGSS